MALVQVLRVADGDATLSLDVVAGLVVGWSLTTTNAVRASIVTAGTGVVLGGDFTAGTHTGPVLSALQWIYAAAGGSASYSLTGGG